MEQEMMKDNEELMRENQLYDTIRGILESSGEMGKLKSILQAKVLNIFRGGDKSAITKSSLAGRDPRVTILNQLIMEYFHWFGYQYSIEMFATESGADRTCPMKGSLESVLGLEANEVPILIDIVDILQQRNALKLKQEMEKQQQPEAQ